VSRNLLARISVAAATIPLILWICYQGGWWLFGMISLFAMIGAVEFLINEGHRLTRVHFWLGFMAVVAILSRLAVGIAGVGGDLQSVTGLFFTEAPWIVLALFLLSAMLFATGKESPDLLFKRHVRLIWGVIYIGLLYPFVFLLGDTLYLPYPDSFSGGDCLLFLFGLLWVGDTAAMGIGSWLGKHKLAPTVSPNKTVEGFVGGLLGAVAIGILMLFWKFSSVPWYHVLLIALGCSIFGQLGDLVESMWKRSLGIKDSSAIIPGHGGVMDRFDSLLFAAPFMYVYLKLFVIG